MWLTGGYFYLVVKFLLTKLFLVGEIRAVENTRWLANLDYFSSISKFLQFFNFSQTFFYKFYIIIIINPKQEIFCRPQFPQNLFKFSPRFYKLISIFSKAVIIPSSPLNCPVIDHLLPYNRYRTWKP